MEQIYRNDDGEYVHMDVFGGVVITQPKYKTKGMLVPVLCLHCRQVYDLTDVTPLASYADCTTFESPCCHKHVDDREWKGSPDIKRLDK